MTNSPLKCAVVGVGYLGRFHAQKYAQLEEAHLIGVCDASFSRAKEVASELGVKAFEKSEDLLGQVDAVTIAATTTAHYELSALFLEAGIHVNVEKPITETLEQAQSLCRMAEAKGLTFTVGHIERFNPVFMELEKKLTQPLMVECKRHAPFRARGSEVSVVHDLMIHDIDLAMKLAKSPVRKVYARGTRLASSTWDAVTASLEFESGFLANISVSRVSSEMHREIRVMEASGIYTCDFINGEIEVAKRSGEQESPVAHDRYKVEKHDALLIETKDFIQSIQSGKPGRVSATDGLSALEIALKVIDEL